MIHPTAILDGEHRTIEKLLDRLERFVLDALRTQTVDVALARRFVAVLAEFVEGRHHEKEDAFLMPLVERRGVPGRLFRLARAIEASEHEPETVAALSRLCDGAERGEGEAITEFARYSLAYADRLRRHIAKEDLVLFPIVEAALREEDRAALVQAFDRIDGSESACAGQERIRMLLREPAAEPVVVRR